MYNRYSCQIRFSIMFNRKKEGKKDRPTKGREGMRQMGLLDMGECYNFDPQTGAAAAIDDDDDIGLEAELLAITQGKAPVREKRPRRGPMPVQDLDSMIEASLRDPVSDEEDDGSDLENDAELIAELQQLSPLKLAPTHPSPTLTSPKRPAPPLPTTEQPVTSSPEPPPPSIETQLEQRLAMYKQALENAAGDSAKTRRFDRGIKTINGLLKSARAGKTIDETQIPPEVAAGPRKTTAKILERTVGPPETSLGPAKIPEMIMEPPKKPEAVSEMTLGPEEISEMAMGPGKIPEMAMGPGKIPEMAPGPGKIPEMAVGPGKTQKPSMESLKKPEIAPEMSSEAPELGPPVSEPSDPMIDLLQWAENLTQLSGPPETETSSAEDEFEMEKKMVFEMLANRKKQYQRAAVDAKKARDTPNAIKYMKIAKQFEVVIVALEQGQPIDLTQMPPPPPGFAVDEPLGSPSPPSSLTTSSSELPDTSDSGAPDPELFKAPPAPVSTLEALEQRREKYVAAMKEAQEQMNTSKGRRMGRIVKQYEDAIGLWKAGKAVPYDELPDPPGFAPIPREGGSAAGGGGGVGPAEKAVGKAKMGVAAGAGVGPSKAVPAPGPSVVKGAGVVQTPRQNIQERQLQNLQQRQKLFRDAALEAKKKGDIEAAKEYLRISKGFNPMIEASKSGLPVNLDTAPIPPQVTRKKEMEVESEGFEVIEVSDCMPQGDREEMYAKLEADLKSQISVKNFWF
uniref:DM14 domain-containing protein n=1 Tax=Strigamia maritima TaxID=126957 RepID=T1JD70_STRMM